MASKRSGKYKAIPLTKTRKNTGMNESSQSTSIDPAASTSSRLSALKENSDSPTRAPTSVIAYVHKLSPTKCNRNNTVNYSTVVLQTNDETIDALLYSASKR
jgi:hypothetical protein